MRRGITPIVGSFIWENGIKDSKVKFFPDSNGNFNLSWVPSFKLQNNVVVKNGKKHPGNEPHGRLNIGIHKSINHVATQKSDYPTNSNTKDQIKFFLDVRDIEYSSSSSKSELLDIVDELKNKKIKITVKGVLHD